MKFQRTHCLNFPVLASVLALATAATHAQHNKAPEACSPGLNSSLYNKPKTIDMRARPEVVKIAHRGYWTYLPKDAVVVLPKSLQKRITDKPSGKFLHFYQFAARNSTWIHTFPISKDKARGFKRVEKFRFDGLKRLNKIVVTTHKKHPITLHKNAYPQTDEGQVSLNNQ